MIDSMTYINKFGLLNSNTLTSIHTHAHTHTPEATGASLPRFSRNQKDAKSSSVATVTVL